MKENVKMTKHLIVAIICTILFGCDSTPIITSKTPFIVNEIVEVGGGLSEYYGSRESGYDINGFSGRPSIVLESRKYNIGDTIRIK